MSKSFLTPINLNNLELLNARIQNLAAAPSHSIGRLYYDTVLGYARISTGTVWIDLVATTPYTDTQARANRLDQFAAPTASVSMNSQLLTNVATPVSGTDAANKNYVDAARAGLDIKDSVRAATTAAGTLASSFANGSTIDGVALVTGNRILIKNQAAGAENGIYTVNATGAPTRATDADVSAEVTTGMATYVEEGTANGGSRWVLTTTGTITLGTTALSFTIDTSANAISAGAGLTGTAGAFSVGAGTGITVAADTVAVDTAVVVRKYAVAVGDGSATSYVITHNLGTLDVTTVVYLNSGTFEEVIVDTEHTSTNTITLRFAVAPAASAYRVVVHG